MCNVYLASTTLLVATRQYPLIDSLAPLFLRPVQGEMIIVSMKDVPSPLCFSFISCWVSSATTARPPARLIRGPPTGCFHALQSNIGRDQRAGPMEHFQIKWGQDYMAGVIFLLDGKRVNGSAKSTFGDVSLIRDTSPLSLLCSAGPGEILARLSRSGVENEIGLF